MGQEDKSQDIKNKELEDETTALTALAAYKTDTGKEGRTYEGNWTFDFICWLIDQNPGYPPAI